MPVRFRLPIVLSSVLLIAVAAAPTIAQAASLRVLARIQVGSPIPGPIFDGAFGAGALWVSIGGDTIARIDPATDTVVATIHVGEGFRHELAIGEGSVWVTNPDEDTVSRIDPATNTVSATIASGGSLPIGVAVTPGAVWVANHHADASGTGSVARIDPLTNALVSVIPLGAETFAGGPGGLVSAPSGVWVAVPNLGVLARIDPATDAVAEMIPVDQPCGIPAAGPGRIWMPGAGCGQPYLGRVDVASDAVTRYNAGGIARFAAADGSNVWVSVTSSSCPPNCPPTSASLARLGAATGDVTGRLKLGGSGFVAVGAGSIWVGSGEEGLVLRVTP